MPCHGANITQRHCSAGGSVGWTVEYQGESEFERGRARVHVNAVIRLFRSVLVTACVVSLAAGAHVAGGGVLPHFALVVALAALILIPVTLLAGRQLTLPVLNGVLAGGQLMMHTAFEMFSANTSCMPTADSATAALTAHSGMGVNHAMSLSACPPVGSGHLGLHLIDAGMTPGMIVTHVLATALTVLLLVRGESAFWRLLAWLRPLIGLPPLVPVVRWPEVPGYQSDMPVPLAWRNLSADPQRGPPAFRCVEAAPN